MAGLIIVGLPRRMRCPLLTRVCEKLIMTETNSSPPLHKAFQMRRLGTGHAVRDVLDASPPSIRCKPMSDRTVFGI